MKQWLKTETAKLAENTAKKCAKRAANTEMTFATATVAAKQCANIATKSATLAANIAKIAETTAVIAELTAIRLTVAPTVITTTASIVTTVITIAAAQTAATANIIITTGAGIAVINKSVKRRLKLIQSQLKKEKPRFSKNAAFLFK